MSARDLADLAERRYDEYVGALAEMVNIDSGSFVPEGTTRMADLCEKRFRSGGWEVDRIIHEPAEGQQQLGDMVIGQLPGSGEGPAILMIGHTDTVFPDGTARERPFTVDEHNFAHGPGVSDMKGGLLGGFFAVEILQEAGVTLGPVTYICNPDEEIGSPFSGAFIKDLAGNADVAFVMEAARENGDVVSSRKGVTDFWIEIVGRAAHAGVEPERGRSAILEAAHKTVELHALNGRWPGVTINVGVLQGGTRPNVVAANVRMQVDIRSPEEATLAEVEQEIERICASNVVDDVEVIAEGRQWHRPMEKKGGTARLAEMAAEIAAEIGFELNDASTGGASDANTTSAAGVPTLDGLGLVGGGDHSLAERADLSSVVPRLSLLAGLIARVGDPSEEREQWKRT
jgi:glutamate carboxypeptidase